MLVTDGQGARGDETPPAAAAGANAASGITAATRAGHQQHPTRQRNAPKRRNRARNTTGSPIKKETLRGHYQKIHPGVPEDQIPAADTLPPAPAPPGRSTAAQSDPGPSPTLPQQPKQRQKPAKQPFTQQQQQQPGQPALNKAPAAPEIVRAIRDNWLQLNQHQPGLGFSFTPEVQTVHSEALKLLDTMVSALTACNPTNRKPRQPAADAGAAGSRRRQQRGGASENKRTVTAPRGMGEKWNSIPGVPSHQKLEKDRDPFFADLGHLFKARNILFHEPWYGVNALRARLTLVRVKQFWERFYEAGTGDAEMLQHIKPPAHSDELLGLAEAEAKRQEVILKHKVATHVVARDDLMGDIINGLEGDDSQPLVSGTLITSSSGGVGKTMLLVGYFASIYGTMRPVAAYHFCSGDDDRPQTTPAFVRSIAAQLAGALRPYGDTLKERNSGHLLRYLDDSHMDLEGGWTSMRSVIWEPLLLLCRAELGAEGAGDELTGKHRLILVDGLNHAVEDDEGRGRRLTRLNSGGRTDGTANIVDLVARSADFLASHPRELGWLKLMCTSRRTVAVERVLGGSCLAEYDLDSAPAKQKADNHVWLYIKARINSPSLLLRQLVEEAHRLGLEERMAEVKARLLDQVAAKAGGVFLKAVNLLDDVESGRVAFHMLDQVPSQAEDQLLARLTRSVRPEEFFLFRPIVVVLMASYHPPTSEELLEAVRLDQKAAGHYKGVGGLGAMEEALSRLRSCGLVEVRRIEPGPRHPEAAQDARRGGRTPYYRGHGQEGWKLSAGVRECLGRAGGYTDRADWRAYQCLAVSGHVLLAAKGLCYLTRPQAPDFDPTAQRELLQELLAVQPPPCSAMGPAVAARPGTLELLYRIDYALKHLLACAEGSQAKTKQLGQLVLATGRDFTADVTGWHSPLQATPPPRKGSRAAPLFWLAGRAWQKPGDGNSLEMLLHSLPLEALRAPHPDMACTPLTLAAGEGRMEALRLLVAHGVPIGEADRHGRTVLHLAVSSKSERASSSVRHLQEMEEFAAQEAALCAAQDTWQRRTALHMAIRSTDWLEGSCVLRALMQGTAPDGVTRTVDLQDRDGLTPLMTAVQFQNLDAIRELLPDGGVGGPRADPLVVDNSGRSALHLASVVQRKGARRDHEGAEAVVELLLGRAPELREAQHLNRVDAAGDTPLSMACREGAVGVVRALLKCEAVDTEGAQGNLPPLAAAAINERVAVLMELKGRVDVNQKDRQAGKSALAWAAEHAKASSITNLLLWEGVDPSLKSADGRTPLMHLVAAGGASTDPPDGGKQYRAAVERLAAAAAGADRWACAMSAAGSGNVRFLRALLGADLLDVRSESGINGMALLEAAAAGGHAEVVKLLQMALSSADTAYLDEA